MRDTPAFMTSSLFALSRMSRPLRVHFVGNTCNNHFVLARYLRQLGVDAHLFYNRDLDPQTFPESEDPSIARERPAWLHPFTTADAGHEPWRRCASPLSEALAACDLLHVEDVGLVWAAQTGRPYLWYPYGYDLNKYPFATYWASEWSPLHPDRYLASVAYRKAIAQASEVLCGMWYQPLAHGWALLQQLVEPTRFTHDIQLALDTDRFSADIDAADAGNTLQALLDAAGVECRVEGLRIFHPSRVMFTERSYVNKANDRLFRALGRFRAQGGTFTLVLVARGLEDEADARTLFSELGIADRVAWLPVMSRHALVPWYQASEIVADEFLGGTLGSVSFEAMACGAVLLTRLATHDDDPTFWPPTQTFPELPPVLNASEESEILARLLESAADAPALLARRRASRQWAETWVSGGRVAARLLAVYERILRAASTTSSRFPETARLSSERRAWIAEAATRTPEEALRRVAVCLDEAPADPSCIEEMERALHRQGAVHAVAAVHERARELLTGSMPAPFTPREDPRPRILCIADVPRWIFERHVHTLQRMLADEFMIELAYRGEPYSESMYDLVYPLEYNLVAPDRIHAPWKYVTALRSHLSWDDLPPRILARYLSRWYQRTHVVSERLHRLFAPVLPGVVTLTHGFDGDRFPLVRRERAAGEPLRVGWAGNRASPAKGFDTLIAPLATCTGVELIVCGYGGRHLSVDDMPTFYAEVDVYVCSSSSEGNNNALLEAAASGCAIVTTDVGTVPEYLRHEESALIVPPEAEAIRTAVERCRDDKPLRQRLGRAANASVVPNWTWRVRAEEHRHFFREALASRDEASARMSVPSGSRSVAESVVVALDALQRALAAGQIAVARSTAERLVVLDPTNGDFRRLYRELHPDVS